MAPITMVLWVVTGTIAAWAQTAPLPPPPLSLGPAGLMERARERMQINMTSQPNYTCLETVERTRRLSGSAQQIEDTLRLEVALVDGREMFAWPGSKQFEDKEISELVSTGLFGNGNYGIYTRMLFSGDGPAFTHVGRAEVRGRAAEQFRYRVPLASSGYWVSVNKVSERVAFHGSVYVDPVTEDVVRMELAAQDIPPQLALTATESSVDFGRVRMAEDSEPFLLPVESTLLMAGDSSVSRNRIRFSGCRKFVGESSIILDDTEMRQAAVAVVQEVSLPTGTELEVEFRAAIPLVSAATGDVVTAELKMDIKDGKRVLVPKGAIAKGRILQLERSPNVTLLLVRFTELTWLGGHASFNAQVLRSTGILSARFGRVALYEGYLRFQVAVPPDLKSSRWMFQTLP